MQKSGKLELTWVGKYDEKEIEPRILVENLELSYGDHMPEKSSVFTSIHRTIRAVLLNTMTMVWNIVNG